MLGVFRKNVKTIDDPLAPDLPGPEYTPALKDGYLEKYFAETYKHSVIVSLGTYGFLAYSADKKISPSPTPMFCMRSGVYCVYRGCMKLAEDRKKRGQRGDELDILIACYADVIKKGNKTPFEVLVGDYNYILYDSFTSRISTLKSAFAVNGFADISLYYGLDSEGCCIISDDVNIMEKICGDSFKDIPKGSGLLIPVLVETKLELIEDSSLDDNGSEIESGGELSELKLSEGSSSSKKISGKEVAEASSSGGSGSVVAVEKSEKIADIVQKVPNALLLDSDRDKLCVFCNGFWRKSGGEVGLAAVLKNGVGVQAVCYRWYENGIPGNEVEGRALCFGMLMADQLKLKQIIFVSNSLDTINAVSKYCDGSRGTRVWLGECQRYLSKWPCWEVKHTTREGNFLADEVARLAFNSKSSWMNPWAIPTSVGLIIHSSKKDSGEVNDNSSKKEDEGIANAAGTGTTDKR